MEHTLDKTAEIEVRLREIRIGPDNTCLFFKEKIVPVSRSRKCLNCIYACFETDIKPENIDGFCSFKTGKSKVMP